MHPASLPPFSELHPQNDAERLALEQAWFDEKRAMWRDGETLLRFVRRHREEILRVTSLNASDEELVRAAKLAIVGAKSVNMPEELRAQMKEIENEIWYQGATTAAERLRVKLEWTRVHAASWRRWRVLEYLYVIDRCRAQVLEILRGI
ncbi:MAG: hypothetical protein JNL39_12210 [Opitutaceae bacterium]|nr:hypothetical protein [Opitutaceae bacterium]